MQRIARRADRDLFRELDQWARGRSGAALVHTRRRGRPLRSCHCCGFHCPRRRRACRLERRSRSSLLRDAHRRYWGLARTGAVRFATGHDVGRCRVACTHVGGSVGASAQAVGLAHQRSTPQAAAVGDRGNARPDRSRVARLSDLLRLEPNGPGMVAYGKQRGYRRFTLVCRETENPDSFVHLRHFAPANGLPEDPVTARSRGSRDLPRPGGIVAVWRASCIDWRTGARDRRGIVTVEVQRQAGRISDVRIGGTARHRCPRRRPGGSKQNGARSRCSPASHLDSGRVKKGLPTAGPPP